MVTTRLPPNPRTPAYSAGEQSVRGPDPIIVGVVNNMPDAALRTTERQFRELISAASGIIPVQVKLFALPEVPRSEEGRSHVSHQYEDISELWDGHVDGLIVTGTEPRASNLTDEPYWSALTKLIEWAAERTASTIWSCLAAHAAVLHLDGIRRRPLPQKLCGVVECMKTADDPILDGMPPRWRVPHSRYNGLPEHALAMKGYRILSQSAEVGADLFVKRGQSLFVFLQGHPEYDSGALLREYRRDIGRFLAGERDAYPEMPQGYLDAEATAAFASFRSSARPLASDLLTQFPAVDRSLAHHWREPAIRIYANWLSYLAADRSRRLEKPALPQHVGRTSVPGST